MNILAIESSCDETSGAVIKNSEVLSNVISSQHFHGKYGGVVPELASRAHIKLISKVIRESLEEASANMNDLDAIAVTSKPGLIGSLIVGSNFAKGLSLKYQKPVIPVNHIEGHLYSGCLQDPELKFPLITLVVSGGHTAIFLVKSFSEYSILGATRDDAAGEAFDKIATLLGLTYPGGPEIDKLAKEGDPKAYDFPRSMIHDKSFDFSFSGLKTSVRYFLNKNFKEGIDEKALPDLAASVQAAIVEVLVYKTIGAANKFKVGSIVIAGGVSANSELRRKMTESGAKRGIKVVAPELSYCMDNAAMIGFIAEKKYEGSINKEFRDLTFRVNSSAIRAKSKKRKKS